MKTLFLITTTFVIGCFNSYCQKNDDPLSMPWMLKASLNEHKNLWKEKGYISLETNYEKCIIIYDDTTVGITSFIDFSNGWKIVEEVVIASESPETYNMYFEFCVENYLKKRSKNSDEIFFAANPDAKITFSTKKLSDGLFYLIRITPTCLGC